LNEQSPDDRHKRPAKCPGIPTVKVHAVYP